jgi:hypothetical protein
MIGKRRNGRPRNASDDNSEDLLLQGHTVAKIIRHQDGTVLELLITRNF